MKYNIVIVGNIYHKDELIGQFELEQDAHLNPNDIDESLKHVIKVMTETVDLPVFKDFTYEILTINYTKEKKVC